MSTPAVYTFKGDPRSNQADIHLVYHSDGYPCGAAEIIPALATVACRIWNGENVDLNDLRLPSIEAVDRRENLEVSKPSTPFRYEIELIDSKPIAVRALRHQPVISDELMQRLESAREALKAVEREMQEAREVPTYTEIGKGNLTTIQKLGDGYSDEE